MSPPMPAMPSAGGAPPIAPCAWDWASFILLKRPTGPPFVECESFSTLGARGAYCKEPGALQPQLLRQDLAHDLVGAAANRPEAGVARRALDPVLLHVAGAAEDLERLVGHLEHVALGDELGHRHLFGRVDSVDEQAQPVVGDVASALVLDRHLGD